ncbi:MAG: hypothetical protein J6P80_02785 [Kiritimatiellae bacterium]|nr:hypothetical protein [Kiritimatiellia bacterium]
MLAPEGFGERWRPTRNKEALCAKGRMLFLSLVADRFFLSFPAFSLDGKGGNSV